MYIYLKRNLIFSNVEKTFIAFTFTVMLERSHTTYQEKKFLFFQLRTGWSGGVMMLGKLPVPGRPTILVTVGQGPIALAVGVGGGGLDIFILIYPFSSFSLSLGDGSI